MCGLTGILAGVAAIPNTQVALVQAMTSRLAHRGPDAQGVWVDGPVALGHRRLSIVELSNAGAQPMLSASGRYVIVFNGEIYNHRDLRSELDDASKGSSWRGSSDTETLLACIDVWGIKETVLRLNGMFAFAVWDLQTRTLVLGRDRMGEKPLYWGWAGESLVFGSELKALMAHPACASDICEDALEQYFHFSYVPAPLSIYRGVYKLQPGCLLYVRGYPPRTRPSSPLKPGDVYETLELVSYWNLSEQFGRFANTFSGSPEDAVNLIEQRLEQAIERQMLADVPLGAFLSGGVDSSLVVALMQRQSHQPVKTFTIGFQDKSFDESHFARDVAGHLHTDHHELVVNDKDAIDVVPSLPHVYDEPFADSSQIPTILVSKLARYHVTVALSGDAGDELFCGYGRYFWAPKIWSHIGRLPGTLRSATGHMVGGASPRALANLSKVFGTGKSVAQLRQIAAHMRHANSVQGVFEGILTSWPDGAPMTRRSPQLSLPWPTTSMPASLRRDDKALMMCKDLCAYLPDDILCKVDRAAMSVSLETRVPFLDVSVIEAAMTIPTSLKTMDGAGKWVLRDLLKRYVPKTLTDRPKTGFGVPLGQWLRGPLHPWAESLLTNDALKASGKLDAGRVKTLWAEHLESLIDHSDALWSVLMFQAWYHDRHSHAPFTHQGYKMKEVAHS